MNSQKELRKSKTLYFETFFKETTDSRKCWRVINEQFGNSKNKCLNASKKL